MKIYASFKLKGINTSEDFLNQTTNTLNFKEIHFIVPNKDNMNMVSLHLDFNEISWRFDNSNGSLTVGFSRLADTWNDLNLRENSYDINDVSLNLLENGYIKSYALSLEKNDGSLFTDIELIDIGYLDKNRKIVLFNANSVAVNKAA